MIHIVIPEGLNRPDAAHDPLSDYYEECLRSVALLAGIGDAVYLAPGNSFGHSHPEDELASVFLQQLRPDLLAYCVPGPRPHYMDTLDNAACLRDWAHRHNRWPLPDCWLYCTRFHVFRTWFCFRVAGYRPNRVVASTPANRSGLIVTRLKHYDYPIAHILYEVLAVGYSVLRLARNYLLTGSLLPALE